MLIVSFFLEVHNAQTFLLSGLLQEAIKISPYCSSIGLVDPLGHIIAKV